MAEGLDQSLLQFLLGRVRTQQQGVKTCVGSWQPVGWKDR